MINAFPLLKCAAYLAIRDATGASTATISRVNKCYEYGQGGYRTVLERLKERSTEEKTK